MIILSSKVLSSSQLSQEKQVQVHLLQKVLLSLKQKSTNIMKKVVPKKKVKKFSKTTMKPTIK
jgi:hypothetical protein